MRRILAILLLIFLCPALFCAPVVLFDMKSVALGGVGMSSSSGELAFFHNPASLAFRQGSSSFALGGSFQNTIDPAAFAEGRPNPFLSGTQMVQNLRFIGRNAAISIDLVDKLNLLSYAADGSYGIYDTINVADLQLSVAYGWKNLAFGFSINGGNGSIRDSVIIHDNNSFIDYILQTLFERYQGLFGSEYVSFTFGVLGKVGDFSIGLTLDELTSVGDGNAITPSLGAMLTTLGFGINYTGGKYDSRTAALVFAVPSVSLEVHNAFLSSVAGTDHEVSLPAKLIRQSIGVLRRSELCLGFELMFQLSSRFSVSFLTGLRSGSFGSEFLSGATHSIGAGMTSEKVRVQMAFQLPVGVYMGTTRSVALNLGLDLSL